MLYVLDSNILIYAKMDAMPEHRIVSRWLESALSGNDHSIVICETSILSFLRITTNAKVFDPPLPVDEARLFLNSLLDHPGTSISVPSPGHFDEVAELMKKHDLVGNLTMDAHLAVLALGTGATLVTRDRDFKKVPYLKLLDPLKG